MIPGRLRARNKKDASGAGTIVLNDLANAV